ncbi:MAG: hypothetical protein ACI3W5_07490 [Faecousia sp.]
MVKFPKYSNIVVYYLNGDVQEYFGALYSDDNMLHIELAYERCTVHIPLVSIQRYTTDR